MQHNSYIVIISLKYSQPQKYSWKQYLKNSQIYSSICYKYSFTFEKTVKFTNKYICIIELQKKVLKQITDH